MASFKRVTSIAADEKNNRQIHAVGIIFMVTLLIINLIGFVTLDAARDPYIVANVCIDSVCLLFTIILFSCCMECHFGIERHRSFFITMISVTGLIFFCNGLFVEINGLALASQTTFSVNTMTYVLSALYWLLFWFFTQDYLPKTPLKKATDIVAYVLIGAYLAVIAFNIFRPVLFEVDQEGVIRYINDDLLSHGFQLVWILFNLIDIFISCKDKKTRNTLIRFFVFPLFSTAAWIAASYLIFEIPMISLRYVSLLLALYVVFFYVYEEDSHAFYKQKSENAELQTAMMLSQIQPHFLFNSLSVISSLCETDPATARDATDKFADYLRENMRSLDRKAPVSFETELKHIEAYVWLEKMRFHDNLEVEYRIATTGFFVPSLSVQPLVENAIRHGIHKKKGGGKVILSTEETDTSFIITVEDNGVGFDTTVPPNDGRLHVGINNVRDRLSLMIGGTLTIDSTPGVGTKVTVIINKERSV